jgi:nitrate/TMAO reductase-like tetraheme cytochrome c subunit
MNFMMVVMMMTVTTTMMTTIMTMTIVTLTTLIQQSNKLLENLVSKIPELTCHHYTAKQQARYLKESEENLQSDQCVILADFSGNYSFIF